MAGFEADRYFKEGKRQGHEDLKEIRIRFRPKTLERIILVSLIIILMGYIIVSNVFYPCECQTGNNVVTGASLKAETATMATAEPTTEATETTDTEIIAAETETEEDTIAVQEEETKNESEPGETIYTPEDASASITFSSSDIETDGIKIDKISFKLKNNVDMILRARVDASWYDNSDQGVMKDKVCGSSSFVVPASGTVDGEITEFSRRYTNSENSAETFVLRVYEATTEKLLDTAIVIVTI